MNGHRIPGERRQRESRVGETGEEGEIAGTRLIVGSRCSLTQSVEDCEWRDRRDSNPKSSSDQVVDNHEIKGFYKRAVDTDMDTLFRRGSSNADTNCRTMGQSQQGIKEGGLGHYSYFISILLSSAFMSSTSSFGPKIFACSPQFKIHPLSSMRLLTVIEKSILPSFLFLIF